MYGGFALLDHSLLPAIQTPSITRLGVRAGEARGAAAPPNFGHLRFFWAARENLGKTSFLRRFRVFKIIILKR